MTMPNKPLLANLKAHLIGQFATYMNFVINFRFVPFFRFVRSQIENVNDSIYVHFCHVGGIPAMQKKNEFSSLNSAEK